MTDTPELCDSARRAVSASIDGESAPEGVHAVHLQACDACRSWLAAARSIAANAAALPGPAPAADGRPIGIAAAMAEWDAAARPRGRQAGVARVLMALAGVSGLILTTWGLVDAEYLHSAGAHIGRELYAFEGALALAFCLAAWRPERHVRALIPLTAVVVIAVVLPSTVTGDTRGLTLASELAHLPAAVGLAALLLFVDSTRGRHRVPRTATA